MAAEPTEIQGFDELRRTQQLSEQRLRPPANLARYDTEHFLGAGAYGEVWVARERNTGRRVAIKFYSHRGSLDWALLSREVEKLAFLSADRYVVQLIEVGWDAEPPFYVMEYLERGSLQDRLEAGPLPAAEAVTLFREVAVGLLHAHGKGILHCDLKPGNVLLDEDWKPRLADFGQSRLSHEQIPALGTLFYMAPEQADLQAVPDARWDVYALGALLYCMLTGQPPHRSQRATESLEQASDLEQRLAAYRKMLAQAPLPVSHRKIRGVDRALSEIIDRCLAVDPEKRYPNVQAVLDALEDRATRKARTPLLVLGFVSPALLMLVMSLFGWQALNRAVQQPDELLTQSALESNRFAAQLVAEKVANKLDRRWRILEQEASDAAFAELLRQASDQATQHPARRQLQRWIESLHNRHAGIEATSWFVTDRRGNQIARSPLELATLDKNYAYRDYFHGEGRDYPEGTAKEPLRDVHRSLVFTSKATNRRMVAFTVPIRNREGNPSDPEILGVLAMTVELGRFADLRPENGDQDAQMAVLIDCQEDSQGKRGSIIEHPYLAELLRQKTRLPEFRHEEEQVRRLEELRAAKRLKSQQPLDQQLTLYPHYRDPVGGDYEGRWLAAAEPVFVEGRHAAVEDTGWIVVVQQRYNRVTEPVRELGRHLVYLGLIALSIVVVVATLLWGLVVRMLK